MLLFCFSFPDRMNLLTDTLRCVQFIYSVPFKAAHWASLKVANNVKEWHPLNLLTRSSKYGIIILNQPLAFKEDQVVTLWNRGWILKLILLLLLFMLIL